MPIYAYSPELALEFRRQHRRQVVRTRGKKMRQQAEKERPVRIASLDRALDRAIDGDRD